MPKEKQYIVIYHLDWEWSGADYGEHERNVFGPASLDDCERCVEEERNNQYNTNVYDVTYYEVKPVKGRYIWKETDNGDERKR